MRFQPMLPIVLAISLSACVPATPPTGTVPASSSSSSVASSVSETDNLIRNVNMKNGDTLKSGMTITGEARGTWFFEASFPVQLLDDKGVLIVQKPAQAQGEWMTEDFVPFSVQLVFTTSAKTGTLVLKNDNPSGEPERDKSIGISVIFEQ